MMKTEDKIIMHLFRFGEILWEIIVGLFTIVLAVIRGIVSLLGGK